MFLLDPKAASPVPCWKLSFRSRCVVESAADALGDTIKFGTCGVSLLWRTFPRGKLGFFILRPEAAAFRGCGSSPSTARSVGGELPAEFRKPRGSRWRGDCTLRRPRPRSHALVRSSNPLGTREQLRTH